MSVSPHVQVEQPASASPWPRAAYIHVPFCRHRCGYCNFTLVAGRDDLIDSYLCAVEAELRTLSVPREVDTLYFGGGTPSHLAPRALESLFSTVLRWHPLAEGFEWTLEANPADVNVDLIQSATSHGVNRLSLGVQSFRSEKLALLERDHGQAEVEDAVALARRHGMQVALDLIFAAPGETLIQWSEDLYRALQLEPDHISTYGLTFERGTRFWNRRLHGELKESDEQLQRDMYALAIDRLAGAGFEHYEISNFARSGYRSRHNETYWTGDGYFAAGPGASRYVHQVRETNCRSTTQYIRSVLAGHSPVAERERLSPAARARELLVFGLRRLDGVSKQNFCRKSGFEIESLVGPPLRRFIELGLLEDDGARIRLTREGLFVSDAIWPELI